MTSDRIKGRFIILCIYAVASYSNRFSDTPPVSQLV